MIKNVIRVTMAEKMAMGKIMTNSKQILTCPPWPVDGMEMAR